MTEKNQFVAEFRLSFPCLVRRIFYRRTVLPGSHDGSLKKVIVISRNLNDISRKSIMHYLFFKVRIDYILVMWKLFSHSAIQNIQDLCGIAHSELPTGRYNYFFRFGTYKLCNVLFHLVQVLVFLIQTALILHFQTYIT